MTNVVRSLPQKVLPYIDFSTHTPYRSATEWSESASSVKLRPWPSWNFFTAFTGSGDTPRTTAPAASYSSTRSRTPHACVVQPGVSALG
jgi:hypothetical protein